MKNFKLYFTLLLPLIVPLSSFSYACEMELSELVSKTDIAEKFTNYRYLIKSGKKWFYISQDNDCWISIRYVKSSEDQEIQN